MKRFKATATKKLLSDAGAVLVVAALCCFALILPVPLFLGAWDAIKQQQWLQLWGCTVGVCVYTLALGYVLVRVFSK